MRQERKVHASRSEKFEDGVLRADACSERYALPRDMQYRTAAEDLPAYSFGASALREEGRLMRDVHELMSLGLVIQGTESPEKFVARYRALLGEESSSQERRR